MFFKKIAFNVHYDFHMYKISRPDSCMRCPRARGTCLVSIITRLIHVKIQILYNQLRNDWFGILNNPKKFHEIYDE